MPRMISIARADRNKVPADHVAAHNAAFGTCATMLATFPHGGDTSQIAALFEVHDLEGLRRHSRTAEADAKMRDMGFVEQSDQLPRGLTPRAVGLALRAQTRPSPLTRGPPRRQPKAKPEALPVSILDQRLAPCA